MTLTDHSNQEVVVFRNLFNEFHRIVINENSLVTKFSAFLHEFSDRSQSSQVENTLSDYQIFFGEFEQKLKASIVINAQNPPNINLFDVAEFGSDEVRNCRILCWFLDPCETHCQGNQFLIHLLKELKIQETLENQRIRVQREVITAEGDSRLDVLIKAKDFEICIEAKISATEDIEQLSRYYKQRGRRVVASGRKFYGYLLTSKGKSGEDLTKGFKRATWGNIVNAFKRFADETKSIFVKHIAANYADYLNNNIVGR